MFRKNTFFRWQNFQALSGDYIAVSPLTEKNVKRINNSSVHDHLLHCNYLPSLDNFSILAHENKVFIGN